jgi:hypothetical protein
MAKSKSKGEIATSAPTPGHMDKWEVRDAMHTMLRAAKIVKDKKLLAAVKKEAMSHAKELEETAAQAGALAKMGRISPKQMAKLGH